MIVLGRVAAPFGVHGWVRLRTYTQAPDGVLQYPELWLGEGGNWTARRIEQGAPHGRGVVVKLQGCDEREAAALLQGQDVAVPRRALPASGGGEHYWADLQGLAVRNLQGEKLGRVAGLLATGANDVLVVEADRERLIPFVEQFVVAVNLDAGEVIVDWSAED
jgi:16S rRNA processing protein RimM